MPLPGWQTCITVMLTVMMTEAQITRVVSTTRKWHLVLGQAGAYLGDPIQYVDEPQYPEQFIIGTSR